jgi:16S rRNA (guanine(966)-N(2))-methyltransferase RsmD
MRIIGGIYRSRIISMPKGVRIRPTQDKVRQAVFNIISDCSGRIVLDIFSGSGAFGIEALSRGASFVKFADNDPRCLRAIADNLNSLDIPGSRYALLRSDGSVIGDRLKNSGEKYDLVFMDPPYYDDLARICLINLEYNNIISDRGIVVVEHFKGDDLGGDPGRLVCLKKRRYGDTAISIFGRTR